MTLQKRVRAFVVVAFFTCFLIGASLASCGKKAVEETTEHPTDAEHPKADSAQEHPTEADTVKSE